MYSLDQTFTVLFVEFQSNSIISLKIIEKSTRMWAEL